MQENSSIPKAIIIVTYPGSPWLDECVASIKDSKIPILLCENTPEHNAYDPAGLFFVKHGPVPIERFILLHDSYIVKDLTALEALLDEEGCVCFAPKGLMLLGKYDTKDLPDLGVAPHGKRQAVDAEFRISSSIPWKRCYDETFVDGNHRFEEKNGRLNMVLENSLGTKYKGTWDTSQIKE